MECLCERGEYDFFSFIVVVVLMVCYDGFVDDNILDFGSCGGLGC